ncbi:hypothetical protein Tsubulata_005727 [Turnera subulata]|uniref:Uncharacterized protein n=1 Tax=Turnera subulata TaxID=218843 RepID=A0A9Q0JK57_9ROSI|nr:hypothetical protein Tsubulata_005727 [Turnera subulata]
MVLAVPLLNPSSCTLAPPPPPPPSSAPKEATRGGHIRFRNNKIIITLRSPPVDPLPHPNPDNPKSHDSDNNNSSSCNHGGNPVPAAATADVEGTTKPPPPPAYSVVDTVAEVEGSKKEKEDKKKRSAFTMALTREEIEEDIMAIMGEKRVKSRPKKKRPRDVKKNLDTSFPGLFLHTITPDKYKLRGRHY